MTKIISQLRCDQQIPKLSPCHPGKVGVHACYAVERSMYSEICSEVGLYAGPPAPEFLRILAIEKIAHSFSSGCILFAALRFIPAITGCIGRFGAAFRTVIRKARLARLQLKFFRADGTYFDRKFHNGPINFIRDQFPYNTRAPQERMKVARHAAKRVQMKGIEKEAWPRNAPGSRCTLSNYRQTSQWLY
jgi:hypothetical protein